MTTLTYQVGHQPTATGPGNEPGHEENVPGSWYNAVDLLYRLMRDWAVRDDQDNRRELDDNDTAERVEKALRHAPPVYPADARYEITTPEGVNRVFYLMAVSS